MCSAIGSLSVIQKANEYTRRRFAS
jgi:hypothetical protein